MKGLVFILFLVFFLVAPLQSQKRYEKKTTSTQQVEYYKKASIEELEVVLSKADPTESSWATIKALIELKKSADGGNAGKKAPKKGGNSGGNANYNHNYNKPASKTANQKDTALFNALKGLLAGQEEIAGQIKKIEERLNGIDDRLDGLDESIGKKIDSLAVLIVQTNNNYVSSVEKSITMADADMYLQNGYVMFSSDSHLGLYDSPEETREFALLIKRIAGIRTFDSDWFREYVDTKNVSDPEGKKIVRSVLMLIGLRIKSDNLDYFAEYFETGRNSADIKELFWRFYNLQN